ncbi:hypothetical protein BDR22DRAFT_885711 [Usnea florida]
MLSLFLYLSASYLSAICLAQSTTPAPTASCNYCFIAPGFTDVSTFYGEYLLFTAYSMTSAFAQDGSCITNSGASTALQTPYSVAVPPTATVDPAQYQSAVATWFINFLGVPDWGVCGENGSLAVHLTNAATTRSVNVAVSTSLGIASLTSLTSPTNTVTSLATHCSPPKSGPAALGADAVAVISVVVAVVLLGFVSSGVFLWYEYRGQQAAMNERNIQNKLEVEPEDELPREP